MHVHVYVHVYVLICVFQCIYGLTWTFREEKGVAFPQDHKGIFLKNIPFNLN